MSFQEQLLHRTWVDTRQPHDHKYDLPTGFAILNNFRDSDFATFFDQADNAFGALGKRSAVAFKVDGKVDGYFERVRRKSNRNPFTQKRDPDMALARMTLRTTELHGAETAMTLLINKYNGHNIGLSCVSLLGTVNEIADVGQRFCQSLIMIEGDYGTRDFTPVARPWVAGEPRSPERAFFNQERRTVLTTMPGAA